MPIEFPCAACLKKLRIPDNAAGKLARCPKCGHVGRAPQATAEPGTAWRQNAYASPTIPVTYVDGPAPLSDLTFRMVRNKVAGPAICLIVLGCFHLIFVAVLAVASAGEAARDYYGIFVLAMAVKGGLMIGGGLRMKRLQSHGMALAGALTALVPCCFWYLAELPIGIWALIVLSDQHVKRAFEQRAEAI